MRRDFDNGKIGITVLKPGDMLFVIHSACFPLGQEELHASIYHYETCLQDYGLRPLLPKEIPGTKAAFTSYVSGRKRSCGA